MSTDSAGSSLTYFEAEAYIKNLKCFDVSNVANDEWMRQHELLEKLNIQAHAHAMSKHDEFVMELINTEDKVPVLIHELLLVEGWKINVFPKLLPHLTEFTNIKAYLTLYHEATVINLLEVLLFHEASIESIGDDAVLLELVDYCARKLTMLNDPEKFKSLLHVDETKSDHKARAAMSVQEVIQFQSLELDYKICISTLSVLRYLTQHLNVIPLSAMVRMLDTHDVILLLIPLLENTPWQRTHVYKENNKKKRSQEKFVDQKWKKLENDDRFVLTQIEGQVWLSIYNLICDLKCRQRYRYDTHRKSVIVRLKRFFNSVLIDQLPMLTQLRRSVEELIVMDPPPPTANSFAIVEQVPEIRSDLFQGVDWDKVAAAQAKTVYADTKANRDRDIARFNAAYNLDNFDDVLEEPPCAKCGLPAVNRCSACKNEWYCSRKCQLDSWKAHKPICQLLSKDARKRDESKKKMKETSLEEILADNKAMQDAGDDGSIKKRSNRVKTDNSMLDLEGGETLNAGHEDAVARFAAKNNTSKKPLIIEEVSASSSSSSFSSTEQKKEEVVETLDVKSTSDKPSLIDVLMASKTSSSSSSLSSSSSNSGKPAASSLIEEVTADDMMEQKNTNIWVEEMD